MKTSELTGLALDWAVAKCEGREMRAWRTYKRLNQTNYSTDWSQGGPIIEREKITLIYWRDEQMWEASCPVNGSAVSAHMKDAAPLVAAMRCYVASKLGDEVEVPDELRP